MAAAQVTAGTTAAPGASATARRRRGRRRALLGLTGIVGFFLLWQGLFELGALNPLFIASPSGMFEELWKLMITERTLFPHLKTSSTEFIFGFGLGVGLALVLGILIGWFSWLDDLTEPLLAALYATPYVAFLPLIIVWIGIGLWSKTVIVVWATFFPMLINTVAGVKNTPPDFLRVADSFCVGRGRVLTKVVLPAAVPYLLAGLRQSIGRALVAVIVAEFFLSSEGIGFFINEKASTYQPNQSFAAILVTAVAGIVFVRGVGAIERRVARRWGLSQQA